MASRRPPRRKIRWTRFIILIIMLVAVVTSLSWAAIYTYKKVYSVPTLSTTVENDKPPEVTSRYINILLLGIDNGDLEYPDAPQRTDTMIVASINPEEGTIHLLSIPRDTKVNLPGHKGAEKIAHAFFYGGIDLAKATVEDLLKLPIHHFVVIDWQAFIKTIDILGGVDLYVENNMNYEDPYAKLEIHLNKGYQHLDGSQAGQYVRFRSDELGDIGRVQRQQRFLKALTEQTLQISNLLKVPAFVRTYEQYTTTDLKGLEMVKLAKHLKSFRTGNLNTEMLPGNFATIEGLSYWVHDQEQTRLLVERILVKDDHSKMTGIFIP